MTVASLRGTRTPRPWTLLFSGELILSLGQPQYLTVMIDVTERKRLDEKLNASELKYRTLFDSLTEGVALHQLVMDDGGQVVDYRILDVNPAFQLHTGLDPLGVIGRLASEIYETVVPPYLEEYARVALGGESFVLETFYAPLGKHFRISVISPKHGQFATVFEDVTERKRNEAELEHKNADMEWLTNMISHDLKSPLVTIGVFLGYVEENLAEGKVDGVAKDLGFIREATTKMGNRLEDLLELTRVGRVMNTPEHILLADLIQESLKFVAGAIARRGVAVQVHAPQVNLFGDRTRLEEVWQNLIENAVKYMGAQPEPRLELGAEVRGDETVFFVRDNGVGIEPRFQTKVFRLFEKLDARSDGTGLGLALVQRVVQFYDGRVWAESDGLGLGTCFRFTLPSAMRFPLPADGIRR